MDAPVTFEQVRDFLHEQWRVSPSQISPSTRLLHDLGIDADDAEEILMAFAQRFHVDFSSLAFTRHFGSEFDAGGRWLIRKLFGSDSVRLAPITIQDLIDAANRERWIEHKKHEA